MSTPSTPTTEGFPSPGERIGPYAVVRRIGMGGMGVVFEADDPALRARFTQEAQAQASVDSPHVVQVFAHGEADGALYIASQLIPDGDLGEMIPSASASAASSRPSASGSRRAAGRGGGGCGPWLVAVLISRGSVGARRRWLRRGPPGPARVAGGLGCSLW